MTWKECTFRLVFNVIVVLSLSPLQKEYIEEVECRPTFEQVSQEKIVDEATKNLIVLKSLENIINERMNGFNAQNTSILKARPFFESFEHSDCTIKLALDSLFIFVEQVRFLLF